MNMLRVDYTVRHSCAAEFDDRADIEGADFLTVTNPGKVYALMKPRRGREFPQRKCRIRSFVVETNN